MKQKIKTPHAGTLITQSHSYHALLFYYQILKQDIPSETS